MFGVIKWNNKSTTLLVLVWFMVLLNAIFNNISVISWRSALLVKESGVPGENHRPVEVIDKLYHIMLYRAQLAINAVRTYDFRDQRHWLHRWLEYFQNPIEKSKKYAKSIPHRTQAHDHSLVLLVSGGISIEKWRV